MSSAPADPTVPPSPSWFTRLTRSPGAAVTRRGPPARRSVHSSGAAQHDAPRRSLRARTSVEEMGYNDDDDEHSDGDGAHEGDFAGVHLSTSSLGRNHRLSFLGLLAPPATQNLVRMSSQPPQRRTSHSLVKGGGDHVQHPPPAKKKPKPFLTASLLKLNEILPAYCRALVDPTRGPAQACALLLETSIPATHSPSASPRAAAAKWGTSTTSTSSASGTSPTAGSILHWLAPTSASSAQGSTLPLRFPSNPFASSSSSPPSTSSFSNFATAMQEGEWEACTAPFFLLAAAETLYHDMNHCFQHRVEGEEETTLTRGARRAALERLYVRIGNDVQQVKELLCDPFLANKSTGSDTPSEQGAVPAVDEGSNESSLIRRSVDAAQSLSSTLDVLVAVCRARSQLVAFQCHLFASSAAFFAHGTNAANESDENVVDSSREREEFAPRTSPSSCFVEASLSARLLLQSLPNQGKLSSCMGDSTSSGLQSLYRSIITESTRWKHCLDAACGLDRCQFYDTLLSMRRFKSSLREETSHPKSRLNLWFRGTYDRMTSLLPVYFDRIQVFSTPLYGHDTSLLLNGKSVDTDWNAAVVDVLRKQEKGAPHLSFVLVLDAERAGTTNVPKGLSLASQYGQDATTDQLDSRTAWPALYIRSTLHFSSAGPSVSRPTLTHGSSGYLNSSSQSSLLQNWSIGGNPSTASGSNVVSTRVPLNLSKASVLEYAPESGIASWPHSEWDRLSTILRHQSTDDGSPPSIFKVRAVTYRDQEEDDGLPSRMSDTQDDGSSFLGGSASFDGSSRRSMTIDPTNKDKPKSVFHACPVSDLVTLVAIVESEGDEYRWRRKTGLTDQEIQEALVEFALHFSVVRNFTVYNIPSNQQDSKMVKSLRYAFKACHAPSAPSLKTDASAPRAVRNRESELTDECVGAFLKDVKMAFGLRPVNPSLSQDALRSTATLSPTSRKFLAQRASSITSSTSSLLGLRHHRNRPLEDGPAMLEKSALDLFVGADLASLFS